MNGAQPVAQDLPMRSTLGPKHQDRVHPTRWHLRISRELMIAALYGISGVSGSIATKKPRSLNCVHRAGNRDR